MSECKDDVGVVGLDLLFCHESTWALSYYITVFDEPSFDGKHTEWAKCDEGTYMYGV